VKSQGAGWYFRRLRAMAPGEAVSKVTQRLWIARERAEPAVESPDVSRLDTSSWSSAAESADLTYLVERAESMRGGEWEFLGTRDASPQEWMRDPVTGVVIPSVRSSRIDFRDPAQVGSVKTVWEKNRHQHLQALAAAYWLTGDEAYAGLVKEHLLTWVAQNPYLIGVNWSSGIEVALRLVSWVWIERLLRGASAHEELFGASGALWADAFLSQRLLQNTYSSGSSANNHLLAELLGVFVANAAWPVWSDGVRIADEAWARFQDEVVRQTWPGGFTREQAVGYHAFVTEMATVALLEARLSGRESTDEFSNRLRNMTAAGESFYSRSGARADFGDSDDSQVLGFLETEPARFAAVAALSRAVAGGAAGILPVSRFASAGAQTALGRLKSAPSSPRIGDAEDAGIRQLTAQTPAGRVRVWCDVAPLGMDPLAAHGHADALSFVMHVNDEPLFVDAGTYEFGLSADWRTYFRSSRAHNVVVVDGVDQSVQGGPFLWQTAAVSRLDAHESSDNGGRLVGSHDGYRRLPRVGEVSRELVLTAAGMSITDSVLGEGVHAIESRFHLHPAAVASLRDTGMEITLGARVLHVELEPGLTWEMAVGLDDGGWFSDRFGHKMPTTTVIGRASVTLPWKGSCRVVFS
jgi:hypothetical protein